MPDFIRDINELPCTGLPPEKKNGKPTVAVRGVRSSGALGSLSAE